MEEEQGEWYPSKPFAPPKDYSNAGLFLNNFYIPEEVLTLILSYLDVQDLLKVSLVCKTWCRIIRTFEIWSIKYKRCTKNRKQPKKLPWYVYYAYFYTYFFDRYLLRAYCDCDRAVCIAETRLRSDMLIVLDHKKINSHFIIRERTHGGYRIHIRNPLIQVIIQNYKPHILIRDTIKQIVTFSDYYLEMTVYTSSQIVHRSQIRPRFIEDNPFSTDVETYIDKYNVGEKDPVYCIDFKRFLSDGTNGTGVVGIIKVLFDTMEPLEQEKKAKKKKEKKLKKKKKRKIKCNT